MSGEPTELTRQELYDLIWLEPMRVIGLRLSISDRGLAKICRRLRVPRPGRGHWQRKRAVMASDLLLAKQAAGNP